MSDDSDLQAYLDSGGQSHILGAAPSPVTTQAPTGDLQTFLDSGGTSPHPVPVIPKAASAGAPGTAPEATGSERTVGLGFPEPFGLCLGLCLGLCFGWVRGGTGATLVAGAIGDPLTTVDGVVADGGAPMEAAAVAGTPRIDGTGCPPCVVVVLGVFGA